MSGALSQSQPVEIFLTPDELAERWRIKPGALAHWRVAGEGPAFVKVGGRVLYRLSDVETFERANTHRPGTPRGAKPDRAAVEQTPRGANRGRAARSTLQPPKERTHHG